MQNRWNCTYPVLHPPGKSDMPQNVAAPGCVYGVLPTDIKHCDLLGQSPSDDQYLPYPPMDFEQAASTFSTLAKKFDYWGTHSTAYFKATDSRYGRPKGTIEGFATGKCYRDLRAKLAADQAFLQGYHGSFQMYYFCSKDTNNMVTLYLDYGHITCCSSGIQYLLQNSGGAGAQAGNAAQAGSNPGAWGASTQVGATGSQPSLGATPPAQGYYGSPAAPGFGRSSSQRMISSAALVGFVSLSSVAATLS